METILVPLDGSPTAAEALPHAAGLARRHRAELVLLGIAERSDDGTELERYLEDTREKLEQKARCLVLEGRASEQIVQRARQEPHCLIVMRSHGRHGLSRLWLGSVTDRVIREASCPVLVVHGPQKTDPTYPRILVPLDGTARAQKALAPAIFLAEADNSEITLLRVLDPPAPFYREQPPLEWTPTLTAELKADCEAYLEEHARELRKLEIDVAVRTRRGGAAEQVLEAAAQADLVVLTSHSRSWLERVLLGSVASRVAHHSPCPVLLVPGDSRPTLNPGPDPNQMMEVTI